MNVRRYSDCEACAEAIIARLGKRIVAGAPLGIGKPNALLNALYRRAKADRSIRLDLITALSLNPPWGGSALEERYLQPLRSRIWGDYPRLEYLDDLNAQRLPDNVRVIEFYIQPGTQLGNPAAQQNHISSNYSQVARDMVGRGVNLLLQAVALRVDSGQRRLSLSGNPDISLQLLPRLQTGERPFLACAQINRQLPWLGNHAEVPEELFDLVLDDPALDHAPFAVPQPPLAPADWAIGLRASALVRDGGTLQVGIGALGDAVCHGLRLRRRHNADHAAMLEALGADPEAAAVGGRDALPEGLHVASEMLSYPLFCLFEEDIARKRVYADAALQERVNHGLADLAGLDGPGRGGVVLQGGFLLGPAEFYRRLRDLPEERRALIDMTSVGEVNRLSSNYRLLRLQRRDARFINATMKVTLLGAAVSDQLAHGQVVSGVGGQHDFVSMAQELPDARSILLLRATHGEGRELRSNIVWEYPHATIPRHLRDLVVTEYGVADLRGRTDRECIEAMLAVTDSRFQDALAQQAQRAGKLPAGFRLPPAQRANLPRRIGAALAPYRERGDLPALPFGGDLSEAELRLGTQLRKLQALASRWPGRVRLAAALLWPAPARDPAVAAGLSHLRLTQPRKPSEAWMSRLVRASYRL